jgi:hypothetical protein
MERTRPIRPSSRMRPVDELEQLEQGISDLEDRIFETSSRLAHEAGAFGSYQVLQLMEDGLEAMLQRREELRQRLMRH